MAFVRISRTDRPLDHSRRRLTEVTTFQHSVLSVPESHSQYSSTELRKYSVVAMRSLMRGEVI